VLDEATEGVTRRLAAILVAGYSRLLPGDERENFAELRSFLTGVVEPKITEFGGNVFKETAELALERRTAASESTGGAPNTFPKLLLEHARVRPGGPANREKDYGIWQSWSWAEVARRGRGAGLRARGDRVPAR